MAHQFSKIMFTEAIKRLQEKAGSRRQYERMAQAGPANDVLGADEIEFIGERDSFYIASQGENGWPYMQHRGGPKGFLQVLDGKTLSFNDYPGNKQYVTVGNLLANDKVTLFLMDYPHRTRLKILGHARIVEAGQSSDGTAPVRSPDARPRIERTFIIDVAAFDWNCPKYITPRFTEEELLAQLASMEEPSENRA